MHEVETTLQSLPDGPTQMELYADEEQTHERLAVGLVRFTAYARARDVRDTGEDTPRPREYRRTRKRLPSTQVEMLDDGRSEI